MTFKELKNKIKKELKETAATIRILKAARKPHVYNSNPGLYEKLGYLGSHQYDFRHKHITYCMFFNKTVYKDIERSCNEDPSKYSLDNFKKEWNTILEANDVETIRDSKEGS